MLIRLNILWIVIAIFAPVQIIHAQRAPVPAPSSQTILPCAALFNQYISLITGKSLTVFANQTSVVSNTHLVDALLSKGITTLNR